MAPLDHLDQMLFLSFPSLPGVWDSVWHQAFAALSLRDRLRVYMTSTNWPLGMVWDRPTEVSPSLLRLRDG